MSDRSVPLDDLIEQAAELLSTLVDRGTAWATRVLAATLVTCGLGFVLGVAVMPSAIRDAWVVVAGLFAVLAVGAASVARWRLGAARTRREEFSTELRSAIAFGDEFSRSVLAAVPGAAPSTATTPRPPGLFASIRGLGTVKRTVEGAFGFASAMQALTSFPLLALVATVVGGVFATLIPVFALVLLF